MEGGRTGMEGGRTGGRGWKAGGRAAGDRGWQGESAEGGRVTWGAAALGFPGAPARESREEEERSDAGGRVERSGAEGGATEYRAMSSLCARHSPQIFLPFGPGPRYRARMSSSNVLIRQTLMFGVFGPPMPRMSNTTAEIKHPNRA
jgi:hypothetical protein